MKNSTKPSETDILRVVDRVLMSIAFDSLKRKVGEGLNLLTAEERKVLKHVKAKHFNQPWMVKR
jgi:hypothetical protein